MKLILTIIDDHDSDAVSQALIKADLRVTRIASTGGFFRRGSTTLLIGVADEKVEQAIEAIGENTTPRAEPGDHRATLFVINIEHFIQV